MTDCPWQWTGNGELFVAIYGSKCATIIVTKDEDRPYEARVGDLKTDPDDGLIGLTTHRGGWIIASRETTFEAAEKFCQSRAGFSG